MAWASYGLPYPVTDFLSRLLKVPLFACRIPRHQSSAVFPSGSLIPPYYPPSGCHLGVLAETRWDPSVIAVDPDDADQLVNVLLAHVIEHDVIHVEEVSDGSILKPVSVAGLFDDVARGGQTLYTLSICCTRRCLVQWDWKWPPGWSSIASLGFVWRLP